MRTLDTRVVFENPWMALREDLVERPDGSTGYYAVVECPDFVVVIPFDGERFHLVEQYRYPVRGRYWEFPQGAVRAATTLTPVEMAVIELAEETGITAGHLEPLGFLHGGYGRSTNGFHAYLATDLTPGVPHREVEEQDMRTTAVTPEELWGLVETGACTDAASLAALALLDRAERTGRVRPYR